MVRRISVMAVVAIAGGLLTVPLSGGPRSFVPDWTFTGNALTGWQPVGQADWRVENGEIVGKPRTPEGGWLVLDRQYQDVQVAAGFKCAAGCSAGVMVRAEKTPDGIKGVYVSAMGGEAGAYAVRIDNQGKEVGRERLGGGGGMVRIAPPPAAPAPGAAAAAGTARGGGAAGGGRAGGGAAGGAAAGGGRGRGPVALPGGVASPFPAAPSTALRPDDWNTVETVLDANILRVSFNGGGGAGAGGVANEDAGRFGGIALYAGGTGEVRYREIALKDLARRIEPVEVVSPRFRAQRIDDFYTAWSAAAGDFNRDGVMDVTAGNKYYLGPNFTESHEIYLTQMFNPAKDFTPAMVNFAFDYTGDGWDDVLVVESRPTVLYVNPKGVSRRWDRHQISPAVTSENIVFRDLDNDKKPEVISVGGGVVQYIKPDPANPTGTWTRYVVSEPGPWGVHGVGAGDINSDGRVDILLPYGWFEQPATVTPTTIWTYHPAPFGRPGGGAEIVAYDVNGDKLTDVVTSHAAHGFGLAWYEQKRGAAGAESTWVEHMIMGDYSTKNAGNVTFSELHGMSAADMDGDGIPDVVVGKRHFAHLDSYTDPDPHGPAVLYIYKTVRRAAAPGGAEFVPELVHNRSGVGSMIQTADLNKDGLPDIMAATTRGTWVFFRRK
jgi:hypothetical protein